MKPKIKKDILRRTLRQTSHHDRCNTQPMYYPSSYPRGASVYISRNSLDFPRLWSSTKKPHRESIIRTNDIKEDNTFLVKRPKGISNRNGKRRGMSKKINS